MRWNMGKLIEQSIKFFLILILGVACGYAWATYHAYLRYQQYDKQLRVVKAELDDCEYRVNRCKTKYKYIWARGKTTFEAPKQQPKSGNSTRVRPRVSR